MQLFEFPKKPNVAVGAVDLFVRFWCQGEEARRLTLESCATFAAPMLIWARRQVRRLVQDPVVHDLRIELEVASTFDEIFFYRLCPLES